jgi:hypothetical protein
MPPKKKGKGTARAASTPIADEDAMVIDSPAAETPKPVEGSPKPNEALLNDPWSDEQETSLFKGLMKWKPNGNYVFNLSKFQMLTGSGVHKHFRMVALSEHLRNHGYDPRVHAHTRIPGIWAKLRTLYNMDIIDERENSFEYEDDVKDKYLEFKLPDEDFEEETFMRGKRGDTEADSSPGSSPPRLNRSPSPQVTKKRKRGDTVTKPRDTSVVDDTDDTRTSPAQSSPPKTTTRSGRGTNRSMGRVQAESRSSRQPSKDTTVDEEVDEEAGDAEDDEEEAEEEEGTPSLKGSKTRSKDAPAKAQNRSRKSTRKR